MWLALLAPLVLAVGSSGHGITILAQGRAFCGPFADEGYDEDLLGGRVRLCDNDQPERDDCSDWVLLNKDGSFSIQDHVSDYNPVVDNYPEPYLWFEARCGICEPNGRCPSLDHALLFSRKVPLGCDWDWSFAGAHMVQRRDNLQINLRSDYISRKWPQGPNFPSPWSC